MPQALAGVLIDRADRPDLFGGNRSEVLVDSAVILRGGPETAGQLLCHDQKDDQENHQSCGPDDRNFLRRDPNSQFFHIGPPPGSSGALVQAACDEEDVFFSVRLRIDSGDAEEQYEDEKQMSDQSELIFHGISS